MKILFINDMYTVGGATKALLELVVSLKADGHTPIVCTSKRDDFNTLLDSHGIENIADGHFCVMDGLDEHDLLRHAKYVVKRMRYLLSRNSAVKKIEKRVNLSTVDLIHTNSIRNDIGCMLFKKHGIPHVMHVREFGQEDFSCVIFRPNYYQYLNQGCNGLLAVSDAVKNSVVSKGIDSKLIRTLYDGVDFSRFKTKEINLRDNDTIKIVMTGGICETKGQHIAVQALGYLPEQVRKNVTLDFVGWSDPAYLESLKKLIKELRLEGQVNFLGSKDTVADILWRYNIGLMCSKSEGFGRVTAEYMYAGIGVIAADTGASPELVKDNKTGLIYHRNDPEDLARKIALMYQDPHLMTILGKNAHEDAKTRFSLQTHYGNVMEVYQHILKKPCS